jgi:hypothetical protein
VPDALSVTESVATRFPLAFGENDTAIWQVLLTGRITPLQPSADIEKSPAFVPEMPAEIFERDAFPLLVSVASAVELPGINWFPKLKGVGARTARGVAPLPASQMEKIVPGLP